MLICQLFAFLGSVRSDLFAHFFKKKKSGCATIFYFMQLSRDPETELHEVAKGIDVTKKVEHPWETHELRDITCLHFLGQVCLLRDGHTLSPREQLAHERVYRRPFTEWEFKASPSSVGGIPYASFLFSEC